MEHPSLAKEVLEPLYVDEGLSLRAIALRLGPPISKRMVQRALQRHGVKLRPARPPAYKQLTMSRKLLEKLYVDEGRSLDEVARIVGVNPATVRARLKSLGISRRKGAWRTPGDRVPLSHDLLYQLRGVEGRPAVEIARKLGYSEVQVRSALIRHGIVDLSQKKLVYRLGAGELWWLHHHLRWPIRQITTRLSGHVDDVTARMDELGIARLTSRRPGRPVPRPPDVPEPDLDLLEAVLAGAQRKPRMRRRSAIDQASAEELRRLHLQERLGLTAIGSIYGCAAEQVRRRLEELGIEVRHRRGRRGAVVAEDAQLVRLEELYDRPEIVEALDDLDVPIRHAGEPHDRPLDLTADLLRRLYQQAGLAMVDVGLLTSRSPNAVARALRHHDIEVRKRVPEPEASVAAAQVTVDQDRLAELANQGRDARFIAATMGLPSATTIRIVAQVMEIPLPGDPDPAPVPAEVLEEVRSNGTGFQHAVTVLDPRHMGVGAGHGLPPWPWPPGDALLAYLHTQLGIGLVECADRLRYDVDELKELLREAGIDVKAVPSSHRWRLDPEELSRLYLEEEVPVAQIAARIGVSPSLVNRAMHRLHLPVAAYKGGEPRVRYDELLADPRVAGALTAAGIEPAGKDPAARREPLPASLLESLVGELGLGSFDVELLTGRLGYKVREDLKSSVGNPV